MKIGFAGSGNMAAALARGWARAERGPDSMLFSDAGSGRAAALADDVGGEVVETLAELALEVDAVVLAVKPGALERVAEELGGASDAVASVLGATSVAQLRQAFPETPVVRVMPTITTEIQAGVICHAPLDPADGEPAARLLNLFGELSHLAEVPDELMDAATAVMGCTPAYLAVVVQNIAEAGAAEGLEPEQAYDLVVETFAGTIELLRRYDPVAVRQTVASPGGSTEAGLEALADAGVADGLKAAVAASLERMRGVSPGSFSPVALTRGDIATYVEALFFVYFVLIIGNVILSWVQQFRPIPYNLTLRAVLGFIEDTTNPYLNLFRAFVPRIGPLDISPIIAIIVLSLVGGLITGLIRGVSSRARAWLAMAAVAAAVVVVDQAVKEAIVSSMQPGERTDLALGFELTRVTNSGIAFGLFSGGSDFPVVAFTALALALILGWFAMDSQRGGLWLGVGLLVGGAVGNLVDRITDGAVTDFIDPPLWPAFNVADIAITFGVVAIVIAALRAPPEADADSEPEPLARA